ncbi:hypothetical protein [Flexibacterium corallicola]|uniref:hypothetical protein n=1 Tax=Flexibacterium corallicola TaxID=3037259 RepID=UPI00286EFFC5|nr:hypothetical protein [Pseudovibrio sp. M1P-2-3]
MATAQSEQAQEVAQANLKNHYKPVGIQAIAAANCCGEKQQEQKRHKLDADFPCPTD